MPATVIQTHKDKEKYVKPNRRIDCVVQNVQTEIY